MITGVHDHDGSGDVMKQVTLPAAASGDSPVDV